MDPKVVRKTAIIRELILNEVLQKDIAEKFNVSESYISQIKGKIRNLINPPKIIKGKLVCFKCEQEGNSLDFHHAIGYDGIVAIVCHSCNVRLGQNYLSYRSGEINNKKPIIIWVKEEMFIELSKLASDMEDGNMSKFMRNLFKRVIKNAKD